uniref:DUF6252 family protein n=1 Tax=Flavobacterium sp. TaxID=239 RepID=UPI004049FE5B
MKTIRQTLTVLFLSTALFFSSCSSDDNGGGGTSGAGTITAKVDGASFTSTPQLTLFTEISAGGSTTLSIQGSNMDGKGINISINGFEGVGTYQFGGSALVSNVASYVEGNATNPLATDTWTAPYDDTSLRGEVTITTATDDSIIGTFEFTAKNPADSSVKTITEGSFNL